jgi:hypothetical protein
LAYRSIERLTVRRSPIFNRIATPFRNDSIQALSLVLLCPIAGGLMNTLQYAKKLEEVGFSREQAEMTIGILNEVVESNLASKQDLKDFQAITRQEIRDFKASTQQEIRAFKAEIQEEIKDLRTSTQQDIHELGSSTQREIKDLSSRMTQEFAAIRFEMQQMKSDLVIKLGAMMVTGIAVISALIKLV